MSESVRPLDRAECLHLLAGVTLGRIGFTSRALPMVLPVTFWFDGDRILIRARSGSKLAAATRDAVIAFEVGDVDPFWHTGWSVMVTGVARHVIDPDDLERLAAMHLVRWVPRCGDHVVAIAPELISGRRLLGPGNDPGEPGDSASWDPPLEHGTAIAARDQ